MLMNVRKVRIPLAGDKRALLSESESREGRSTVFSGSCIPRV